MRAKALLLVLALAAGLAAGSTPAFAVTHSTHLRHAAVQSAGSAATQGRIDSRKSSGRRSTKQGSVGSKSTGKSAAKPLAKSKDSASGKSHAQNRRHRKNEPEAVDDPVVMYRAKSRQKTHNSATTRQQTAERHPVEVHHDPVQEAHTPTRRTPPAEAPGRPHGSAAPELAVTPSSSRGIYAQGESHPDDDERLPMHSASTAVASAQPPAPILRATPPAPPPTEDTSDDSDKPEILASTERPTLHSTPDEVIRPIAVPLYTRDGRLIVPAPLKGSHEILVHQNQMADAAGLSRIQDDADLNRMRAQHLLVDFPDTASLEINEELPYNRRCARPWTVKFVTDTARAFYERFHEPLHLSSAVRTVSYQLRLQRVNGNAAAINGDGASPHLTGQAIDFGKHGMSVAEIAWMRTYLLPLMQSGRIDVEEEFQQACFHISVYGSYSQRHAAPKTEVAQLHGGSDE
jgi:hypothetical protein